MVNVSVAIMYKSILDTNGSDFGDNEELYDAPNYCKTTRPLDEFSTTHTFNVFPNEKERRLHRLSQHHLFLFNI